MTSRHRETAYQRLRLDREQRKRTHDQVQRALLMASVAPPVASAEIAADRAMENEPVDAEANANEANAAWSHSDERVCDDGISQMLLSPTAHTNSVYFLCLEQTLRRLCFQARSPFVSCLDEEAFSDLFARMQKQFVHWGHVVFQAGQPADTGMWILLRGRLGLFAQSVRSVFGCL